MIAVVDSGIFMNINYIPNIKGHVYVSTKTLEEIKSHISGYVFMVWSSNTKISVLDPDQESIELVEKMAERMGQNNLSEVDFEVLGLAIMLQSEKSILLYSDDFGLRNVAHELGIESVGFKTTGGNEKRRYGYKCQACFTNYTILVTECETCGSERLMRFRID